MRSKADETLVIVETLICPLQISHLRIVVPPCSPSKILLDPCSMCLQTCVTKIDIFFNDLVKCTLALPFARHYRESRIIGKYYYNKAHLNFKIILEVVQKH